MSEEREISQEAAEALAAAVLDLMPWVEEWQDLTTYPPGKKRMTQALAKARKALALAGRAL